MHLEFRTETVQTNRVPWHGSVSLASSGTKELEEDPDVLNFGVYRMVLGGWACMCRLYRIGCIGPEMMTRPGLLLLDIATKDDSMSNEQGEDLGKVDDGGDESK